MNWISVKERLPEINVTVIIMYPSGFDGFPIYAWGARVDEDEGWMWGISSLGSGIRSDKDAAWNNVEVDDDYDITHWMPLPDPPDNEPKAP